MEFKLVSKYQPAGDQPKAIQSLLKGIEKKLHYQTLHGVTGSGKTFTIANVIEKIQKPTLVITHNKTLAAQLASEFQEFFPHNSVHYFVSYYDYYQPEAYIPKTATYIEKETEINEEIDRLRHASTQSILSRKDTIVVASVSCIYGLGNPDLYLHGRIQIKKGEEIRRQDLLQRLIHMQYERNDIDFTRGTFRVRGEIIDIYPKFTNDRYYRITFYGDEVDAIEEVDYLNNTSLNKVESIDIFPATHYSPPTENRKEILDLIRQDLAVQLKTFRDAGKLLEAERLEQRTNYDLEMIELTGFCKGIENYSRYFDQRQAGEAPYTLMDFFSYQDPDYLLVIDESHISIPQIGGMYNGDRARKINLIDFGFRVPAAADNRPLKFVEFEKKIPNTVFVSATPGPYEREHSLSVAEQIVRPTGLIDPPISIRPSEGQIDDLISEIRKRIAKNHRTIVTTLTKRMSEDLTQYLLDNGIKVQYLHSDIDTMERIDILRDFRLGVYDVIVGINLMREGLDLPEVSLVVILDADKEGFLRSETAFIQIMGRAARNVEGSVIMYADKITGSMQRAIDETDRRRTVQVNYNTEHNIVPQQITKAIHNNRMSGYQSEEEMHKKKEEVDIHGFQLLNGKQKQNYLKELRAKMKIAAENLDFENAANLRDEIKKFEEKY